MAKAEGESAGLKGPRPRRPLKALGRPLEHGDHSARSFCVRASNLQGSAGLIRFPELVPGS